MGVMDSAAIGRRRSDGTPDFNGSDCDLVGCGDDNPTAGGGCGEDPIGAVVVVVTVVVVVIVIVGGGVGGGQQQCEISRLRIRVVNSASSVLSFQVGHSR